MKVVDIVMQPVFFSHAFVVLFRDLLNKLSLQRR